MGILWGPILIAGIAAEFLLLVIANALVEPLFGLQAENVAVFVCGFALMFVAALWVGRKAESRFVLHGTLSGAAAVVFYTALYVRPTMLAWAERDALFFAFHVVKNLGGAVGGLVAGRRSIRASAR